MRSRLKIMAASLLLVAREAGAARVVPPQPQVGAFYFDLELISHDCLAIEGARAPIRSVVDRRRRA
jgi:hypothetical protein